ncbi:Chitin synthase 4 [Malassezia psittaci]|uniref:Chitin synthase 4 n=1 Tax=Malassezia psittaci TaxID=1821823 RepID=A0AAF0F8S8_9BASI|nr:Chitin synthase 4 [Malassezia psittaci]
MSQSSMPIVETKAAGSTRQGAAPAVIPASNHGASIVVPAANERRGQPQAANPSMAAVRPSNPPQTHPSHSLTSSKSTEFQRSQLNPFGNPPPRPSYVRASPSSSPGRPLNRPTQNPSPRSQAPQIVAVNPSSSASRTMHPDRGPYQAQTAYGASIRPSPSSQASVSGIQRPPPNASTNSKPASPTMARPPPMAMQPTNARPPRPAYHANQGASVARPWSPSMRPKLLNSPPPGQGMPLSKSSNQLVQSSQPPQMGSMPPSARPYADTSAGSYSPTSGSNRNLPSNAPAPSSARLLQYQQGGMQPPNSNSSTSQPRSAPVSGASSTPSNGPKAETSLQRPNAPALTPLNTSGMNNDRTSPSATADSVNPSVTSPVMERLSNIQPTIPNPLGDAQTPTSIAHAGTPSSLSDINQSSRAGYSTFAGGTGNGPVPSDLPASSTQRSNSIAHSTTPTTTGNGPMLDHSHLQPGETVSLLSHTETMDMYRQNAKKSNDPQLNYQLAVFMLDVAHSLEDAPENPNSGTDNASEREALIKEATSLLKRLADRGHTDSQYLIGDCYANGFGTSKGKQDFGQAYTYFTLAAKHGHPDAAYRAGTCYEKGWGCRRDAGKAVQFYRKAASLGHPGAQYRLGTAELNGELGLKRSAREGVKWLKRSAESATPEFPHALHELALLHEKGVHNVLFVDHDYSCELLAIACEMGYAPSAYKLGVNYEYGRMGCPQDGGLSIHMYNIAAQQNHKEACFALTAWYLVGAPGILPQSDTEAYLWAKRAAEQGLAKAEYACGYFSEMGVGTRKDLSEAKGWYQLAAEHGDKRANQRLSSLANYQAKKISTNPQAPTDESQAVPVQPLSAPFPGSPINGTARTLGVLKFPTPKAMRETQAFQRDLHYQTLVAITNERERSKERELLGNTPLANTSGAFSPTDTTHAPASQTPRNVSGASVGPQSARPAPPVTGRKVVKPGSEPTPMIQAGPRAGFIPPPKPEPENPASAPQSSGKSSSKPFGQLGAKLFKSSSQSKQAKQAKQAAAASQAASSADPQSKNAGQTPNEPQPTPGALGSQPNPATGASTGPAPNPANLPASQSVAPNQQGLQSTPSGAAPNAIASPTNQAGVVAGMATMAPQSTSAPSNQMPNQPNARPQPTMQPTTQNSTNQQQMALAQRPAQQPGQQPGQQSGQPLRMIQPNRPPPAFDSSRQITQTNNQALQPSNQQPSSALQARPLTQARPNQPGQLVGVGPGQNSKPPSQALLPESQSSQIRVPPPNSASQNARPGAMPVSIRPPNNGSIRTIGQGDMKPGPGGMPPAMRPDGRSPMANIPNKSIAPNSSNASNGTPFARPPSNAPAAYGRPTAPGTTPSSNAIASSGVNNSSPNVRPNVRPNVPPSSMSARPPGSNPFLSGTSAGSTSNLNPAGNSGSNPTQFAPRPGNPSRPPQMNTAGVGSGSYRPTHPAAPGTPSAPPGAGQAARQPSTQPVTSVTPNATGSAPAQAGANTSSAYNTPSQSSASSTFGTPPQGSGADLSRPTLAGFNPRGPPGKPPTATPSAAANSSTGSTGPTSSMPTVDIKNQTQSQPAAAPQSDASDAKKSRKWFGRT